VSHINNYDKVDERFGFLWVACYDSRSVGCSTERCR